MAQTKTALSLAEYREMIADLPLLAAWQINDLVEYVSADHSWYKHLPLLLPGHPFHFYLDPAAGCNCAQIAEDQYELIDPAVRRTFRRVPAECHRSRFGWLTYRGMRYLEIKPEPGRWGRVHADDAAIPWILNSEGRPCQLPEVIVAAGTAELSGVICPFGPANTDSHCMPLGGLFSRRLCPPKPSPNRLKLDATIRSIRPAEKDSYLAEVRSLLDPALPDHPPEDLAAQIAAARAAPQLELWSTFVGPETTLYRTERERQLQVAKRAIVRMLQSRAS
jgi:hypothetical protein